MENYLKKMKKVVMETHPPAPFIRGTAYARRLDIDYITKKKSLNHISHISVLISKNLKKYS